MAFPRIHDYQKHVGQVAEDPIVIQSFWPPVADRLAIMILYRELGGASITTPSGWTSLGLTGILAYYRVLTGSEDPTISIDSSAPTKYIIYKFTCSDYQGIPEGIGTSVGGGGTTATMGTLNPSWGAEDTLYIGTAGENTGWTVTTYPTDYNDFRTTEATALMGCGLAVRYSSADSDTTGTFTFADSSTVRTTGKIAVRQGTTAPYVEATTYKTQAPQIY